MAWLVIILMSLITLVLASQTEELLHVAREYRKITSDMAFKEVSLSLTQYFKETSNFPDSLKVLSDGAGNYPLKMYLPAADTGFISGSFQPVHLKVAPDPGGSDPLLNDGAWQFKRATTYSMLDKQVSPAEFLATANNKCGSGATFSTSVAWCGNDALANWFKIETREEGVAGITAVKEGQIRTLAKFVGYFNANKAFPDPGATTTLRDLVGSPTLSTCTGRYQWQGIPFDCTDLFNKYGKEVLIRRSSLKDLLLYSETPLKDNAGDIVVIGSSISL